MKLGLTAAAPLPAAPAEPAPLAALARLERRRRRSDLARILARITLALALAPR